MITDCYGGNAVPDLLDNGTAFVSQDGRKQTFGVFARKRECIGMTNTGCDIPQQDFAGLRAVQFDLLDFQWFSRLPGDCCACLHRFFAPPFVFLIAARIFARLSGG